MDVAFDSTENVFIADCETTVFKHSLQTVSSFRSLEVDSYQYPYSIMTWCMLFSVNPQGFSVLL